MREYKYRAFISYSHADEQWGDWLHRALETFRVPDGLVGLETAAGPTPKRLTPIFRDRNDLPAAGNLNAEIQAALADTHFQIVLCSPNAAKSKWVNEEIKLFKKLHGPDRTLAIIVDGEPGASALMGRETEECFPPALRFRVDESGEETNEPAEPIAADARKSGDGRRNAILKLAAGLIGVGLDDLVQRDANRRAQRARLFAGGTAMIAASMAVLAVSAFNARDEAHHMRGEAENLIEFMLTDLRGKLEPVGRLDALDVVGEKALDYYANQDARKLDADALGRRSRALLLVGEIDQRRNDLDAALEAYEAAAATTSELLRREPGNPQRIFDHAQSVFYVGDVAAARNELAKAESQFREYLRLSERLIEVDPDNSKWRLELAYATNNLGTLKFKAGDYDAAITYFHQSVVARRTLLDEDPENSGVAFAYAYSLSWLAYAFLTRGDLEDAASVIEQQLEVYDQTAGPNFDDFKVLDAIVTAQRRLAEAKLTLGNISEAKRTVAAAMKTMDRLLARESANANWKLNASYIWQAQSLLAELDGNDALAVSAAKHAVDFARDVHKLNADGLYSQIALGYALARRVKAGGETATLSNARNDLERILTEALAMGGERKAGMIGDASLALADYELRHGRGDRAKEFAAAGVAALEPGLGRLSPVARIYLGGLYLTIGNTVAARRIIEELNASGMAHPDFANLKRRVRRSASN